jgi:predicted nucleic acid-binding protein
MKFWDSSALFSLMVEDGHSPRALAILQRDSAIVSSFITPVEVNCSIWRRRHANTLDSEAHRAADALFAELSLEWIIIGNVDDVIETALSVASRHALRSGDAIQLAAAIVASMHLDNARLDFVTFDNRLATAARAEGFAVLA